MEKQFRSKIYDIIYKIAQRKLTDEEKNEVKKTLLDFAIAAKNEAQKDKITDEDLKNWIEEPNKTQSKTNE